MSGLLRDTALAASFGSTTAISPDRNPPRSILHHQEIAVRAVGVFTAAGCAIRTLLTAIAGIESYPGSFRTVMEIKPSLTHFVAEGFVVYARKRSMVG